MEKEIDKSYLILFNAITDAIRELERDKVITPQKTKALDILENAQCQTEDIYINSPE